MGETGVGGELGEGGGARHGEEAGEGIPEVCGGALGKAEGPRPGTQAGGASPCPSTAQVGNRARSSPEVRVAAGRGANEPREGCFSLMSMPRRL